MKPTWSTREVPRTKDLQARNVVDASNPSFQILTLNLSPFCKGMQNMLSGCIHFTLHV